MEKRTKITYLILGIGIGIVITSTIYSFFPLVKFVELSDDIIISRAKELGMVSLKESIETERKEDIKDAEDTENIEVEDTAQDDSEDNKDIEVEIKNDVKVENERDNEVIVNYDNKVETKRENEIDFKSDNSIEAKKDNEVNINNINKEEDKKDYEIEPIEDNEVIPVEDNQVDIEDSNKVEPIDENKTENVEDEKIEPIVDIDGATEEDKPKKLVVKKGENLRDIANSLFELGLIDNVEKFMLFVKNNGYDRILRFGEYEINLNTDYNDIIKILTNKK